MSGETIDIETEDGIANAYLARPEDGGLHPGVLLVMDAFGLRPQIERMADRIATAGFVVLAPNFFYRAGREPVSMDGVGDPQRRRELFQKIMPLMQELTPARVVADGGAYLDVLEQAAGQGPVGITGYCMGGRLSWLIATAYPDRVAALGAFHAGRLVSEDADSPHLSAGKLAAEVYLGHADNDQSMTPEHIKTLDEALAQAGVRHRSELYEGAAHGYTMADTPAYDEAAAERHFQALVSLLGRTLTPDE